MPLTPLTSAWPPSLPSVPTSRATRVTSSANDESWSTIVLIVRLSSRISPRASTVIFWDRSPLATAVVTCAMLRTWSVRFDAITFTLSVRSCHVPAAPGTSAWPPSTPSVPTSRATPVTWSANVAQRVGHRVDRLGQRRDLALGLDRHLLLQVAARDRRRHVRDLAHLIGQVRRHPVHGVRQVLPRARHARHLGLAAEHAVGAHLARDARHLVGERPQRVGHRVDRLRQRRDLALGLDRHLLLEVALRDRGRHLRDLAHLIGQVRRHPVHRSRSGPSTCRRRPSPRPGRRGGPRCPPRARRA